MYKFHITLNQGIPFFFQKRISTFQLRTRSHPQPKPYISRLQFSTANPPSLQSPSSTAPRQEQNPEFPTVHLQTSLLPNKKALITGASRGIGAAIAARFAHEGVHCVLVGRNTSKLQEVKDSLIGEGHSVLAGDVGSPEFWGKVRRQEKGIEILVNAAGITHYSPLFVTGVESLEEIVQTNLVGTMLACRMVGKGMLGNGGCIINVASLLGAKGGTGSVGYAASKAGVIGLTRALAAEAGKANIRVNVIVPGYIETDMTAAMTPESRSNAVNAIPLKRFGQPSEIADAAVFLAANKYATNCVLNLDGGLSAI